MNTARFTIQYLKQDNRFTVTVFDGSSPIRNEVHYFEEDAMCAAKFLSVEYNCPIKVRAF